MEIAKLGTLGVWTWLDHLGAKEVVAFAQRLETWGYRALWIPEAVGRDPFALIGFLAANTDKLVFATGIANIYARDPMTMRAIRETLGDLSNGRFVLGLGVSHAPMVTGLRKHEYGWAVVASASRMARSRAGDSRSRRPITEIRTPSLAQRAASLIR